MALQVGVTNANEVAMQSATLIMEYPTGARSVDENPRDLFIERMPLDAIAPGETVNIPLRATIFGEENEERIIKASIEYRVENSNALFYKEAEPLRFKISSAPVSMRVSADERASSGQETEITVVISSNSQTTLNDVVVQAEYPTGFSYSSAEPAPFAARNFWIFNTLEPGEEKTITVRGVVGGLEGESVAVHFKAGVPERDDRTRLATIFTTASAVYTIENPFLGLSLRLNRSEESSVTVPPGDEVNGEITIENTLSDTIYDTAVTVTLGGNAVDDGSVRVSNGFYDSNRNTITWDANTETNLREMKPGDAFRLSFSLTPSGGTGRAPNVTLEVSAESRRVSESRVPEALASKVTGEVRVASAPAITTEARRVSGPIPPTVGETTGYTVTVLVENGGNDLNNAEVVFSLPQYITWGEATSGPGSFSYNPTNRTVTWTAGDIDAGGRAVGTVSVELTPSTSQINTIPTLINEQRLSGTDAFTNTVVRATSRAVTAELGTASGLETGNGRVAEGE
jgi:hypothetical protein